MGWAGWMDARFFGVWDSFWVTPGTIMGATFNMSIARFKTAYSRQLALWVLRAFSPSLGRRFFLDRSGYADSDIASWLGLPDDPEGARTVFADLGRLLGALESTRHRVGLPRIARTNLDRFSQDLAMTETELRLVEFFVCLRFESVLQDTCRVLEGMISGDRARFFAAVLGLKRNEVERALSKNGRLRSCRLLSGKSGPFDGPACLRFQSEEVAFHLFQEKYDPMSVLRELGIVLVGDPALPLSSYRHLHRDLDLLLAHLRRAIGDGRAGVNVLLHGLPGTGKTQLTRILGRETGQKVFEVETSVGGREPLPPRDRLANLEFADAFLAKQPSLLVFDEAEDILASGPMNRSIASSHKGWFNRMLERNHRPVFWISNRIGGLDPAFARRFDFILEVPIPPRAERRRIVAAAIGDLVSSEVADQIAAVDCLAPAVIARTGQVIRSAAGDLLEEARSEAVKSHLGRTLEAQGRPNPFRPGACPVATGSFDPAFLNTACDLEALTARLEQARGARLCLYGPPGTGKTSFGRWVAEQLDRPLVATKASDLLCPFVGMTEQRIDEAFREAEREEAILMIDEVDSFLADRSGARHSWEVSQVNEMLTQIDAFPGILIASTNRLESLDSASLRRFDLKVFFDYLSPFLVGRLFRRHCRLLGLGEPTRAEIEGARSLGRCTPGDFAAVSRRHRYAPLTDPSSLLSGVREEIMLKGHVGRTIGFARP